MNLYLALILASLGLPIVLALAFALWLRRAPGMSHDLAVRYWDVFGKSVSVFAALLSGVFLLLKYLDEQAAGALIRENSARRELALREAELIRDTIRLEEARHADRSTYLREASVAATRLAFWQARDAGAIPPEMLARFDELYFADLIGREQRAVADGMIAFRRGVEELGLLRRTDLYSRAFAVSKAVEAEIATSEAGIDALRARLAVTLGTLAPRTLPQKLP